MFVRPHAVRSAALAAGLLLLSAPAVADSFPQLGFEPAPGYLGARQVVLTFDDGPGWSHVTERVLDVLKARGVSATFFVNTGEQATDLGSARARNMLGRMIEEGHTLGSHTRNHGHLGGLSEDALRREVFGVEEDLHALGYDTRLTLFRAPFGEPYEYQFHVDHHGWEPLPVSTYDTIAPIVAEGMVHIGWNIDSRDWTCAAYDGQCVVDHVVSALEHGQHGIITMSSILPQTAEALPALLDYLDAHGYEVVPVEAAVCGAFGAPSANVVDGVAGGCDSGGDDSDDAGDL